MPIYTRRIPKTAKVWFLGTLPLGTGRSWTTPINGVTTRRAGQRSQGDGATMHRNPGGLPLGFRDVHVEPFFSFFNVKMIRGWQKWNINDDPNVLKDQLHPQKLHDIFELQCWSRSHSWGILMRRCSGGLVVIRRWFFSSWDFTALSLMDLCWKKIGECSSSCIQLCAWYVFVWLVLPVKVFSCCFVFQCLFSRKQKV